MKSMILAMVLMTATTSQASESAVRYSNAEGCVVEALVRANGVTYLIQKDGQAASVGVLHNQQSGDIHAFCKNADVQRLEDSSLLVSCGAQSETGAKTTRGTARVRLTGDNKAIAVIGWVEGMFKWKVDTQIECLNLQQE